MSGTPEPKTLLTLLAGHFRGGEVPKTTLLWVEALQKVSSHVVLVFDNPEPNHLPGNWCSATCMTLFDPHGEYDFGSYKKGLQQAEQQGWFDTSTHVLFCNDSVYGPITDLASAIEPMLEKTNEAWGLTESYQLTPHLQSFFLVLGTELLRKPVIRELFDRVVRQPHRQAVIENYELGLSQALLANKVELRALLPANGKGRSANGQLMLNPTAWPLTAIELGMPVLKKKALIDELANKESFSETCRLLAQRNPHLWHAVLRESPHWRLWQEHLNLGILCQSPDLETIAHRLAVLRRRLCCEWTLLLPVPLKHWAGLRIEHAEAIAKGDLTLVQADDDPDNALSSLLACQSDWVVLETAALWKQPHRFALLLRQLIRQPQRDLHPGDPVVVRRHWWLRRGGHHRALRGQHHEQVWINRPATD
jgi:hypothetical protein